MLHKWAMMLAAVSAPVSQLVVSNLTGDLRSKPERKIVVSGAGQRFLRPFTHLVGPGAVCRAEI